MIHNMPVDYAWTTMREKKIKKNDKIGEKINH